MWPLEHNSAICFAGSNRKVFAFMSMETTSDTFNGGDSTSNVLKKVQILQSVNHPRIINLEDVIDIPKLLFIVLELAEGRELFNKIIEKTKLKEAEAILHFF